MNHFTLERNIRARKVLVHVFLIPAMLLINVTAFTQKKFQGLPVNTMMERLQAPSGKLNVVIDTDTYNEIDDQFAVVYALLSPEKLNVQAIYAAPFLNNRSANPGEGMTKSYDEIQNLLGKMGWKRDNFVFRGSDRFMKNVNEPVESEAARDLVTKAMAAEGVLYVLTLGAPTNVASAILMEPQIINKIVVVWLGGAAPDWRTAAEFNLQQDMPASQTLFNSGVPLVQLPTVPVTSHLLTSIPEVEHFLKGQGAIGDYLCQIFRDYHNGAYAWSKVIWDISAIAYAIEPRWFGTELRSSPILTDQITYSVDNRRHFYRVATSLNRDLIFGDMFMKIREFHSEKRK